MVRQSGSWYKGCEFDSLAGRNCRWGEMYSALSTLNTTIEVLLSKAPNPQLLPRSCSINGCPLLWVCVHSVCVCVFVCVCVCSLLWVCTLDGLNAEHEFITAFFLLFTRIEEKRLGWYSLKWMFPLLEFLRVQNVFSPAVWPSFKKLVPYVILSRAIVSQSFSLQPVINMNLSLRCVQVSWKM